MFLVLTHIQGLIVFSRQLLLGSEFISDCLVDPGSTASPFDIGGIQTSHIGFVVGNCVLEGVFFRTGENTVVLYFRMVKFLSIVLTTHFSEVVLTGGNL